MLARATGPLVSFETGTPLRDFDAVAFSVSFENDYRHVLQVLRLAGIPLRASDRGPRDPLVILGGAAMVKAEPLGMSPALLLTLWIGRRSRPDFLRAAAAFFLVTAAVLTPWTIRNWVSAAGPEPGRAGG